MITKTLAELQEPDEASLMFTPWGLARMKPEDAARYQQEAVARYELSAQVPETTRKSFERLRTIYSYGVLSYELYTVAGDQARLVVEEALRDRFLPFYNGTVPFVDGQSRRQSITATGYDAFYRELHSDGRLRKPKNWKLQLASGRAPMRFDGMLTSLLRWARAEGLLGGQRDRIRDRPRVNLRNYTAHPSYHLTTPVDAETEVADLAAIVNRLWGAPLGPPAAREVMIIAWDERTVTWGPASSFSAGPLSGPGTCVIVRAVPGADLANYDSRYEAVTTPCEYLWGPGTLEEVHAWLGSGQPGPDEAAELDRLFLLRYHDSRLYLPQAVGIAAGLDGRQIDGVWYLIRADSPNDAFSHQRQLHAGVQGHSATGHCACPVETLGSGSLKDMLDVAASNGVSTAPTQVPDVRSAMSRVPRCNRILGGGSWDIPPDDPFMVAMLARPTAS